VDPLDYVRDVGRRWVLVLTVTTLALIGGWATMPHAPAAPTTPTVATFSATATLLESADAGQSGQVISLLAQRGDVPERVAEKLGESPEAAAELAADVTVTRDAEAPIVTVQATAIDATRAELLAETFATTLVEYLVERDQVRRDRRIAALEEQYRQTEQETRDLAAQADDNPDDELTRLQADASAQVLSSVFSQILALRQEPPIEQPLEIIERSDAVADEPTAAVVRSSGGTRLLLAGLGGLALGCTLALALARLDTRPQSREDVQDAFGLPVLAEVPPLPFGRRNSMDVEVVAHPESAVADGYRTLRSALQLLEPTPIGRAVKESPRSRGDSPPQVLLVTSTREGEGKTSTVVNLAAAFAEIGKQVLVIDCDLRNPSCHRLLDVPLGSGITDLVGPGLESLARQTKVRNVRLVQAGSDETGHALLAVRLPANFEQARAMADVVLVDTPPVLAGNEAIDVMAAVDSVLLVARPGRATADQVHRARDVIARVQVPVHGVGLVGGRGALPSLPAWIRRPSGRSNGGRVVERDPAGTPSAAVSRPGSEG
jgi:Mrp family chromosome partitioning ATPase/capsular polysaccharide biosynthesis protein